MRLEREKVMLWRQEEEKSMIETISSEKTKYKKVMDLRMTALEDKFNHRVSKQRVE